MQRREPTQLKDNQSPADVPATLSIGVVAGPPPHTSSLEQPALRRTGKELERAVRFIQETVLKLDPKLSGIPFSIETNKVVEKLGVRHEIDVLVKTLLESPYQSVSVFECKDWKKPVGKNEVIILAEKIDILAASRGFLVARKITKDAAAQIKRDGRIIFVQATEDFLSPLNDLQLMHASYEMLPIRLCTKERGVPVKEYPDSLDWKNAEFRANGKPLSFLTFLRPFVDKLVLEKSPETRAIQQQVGSHFDKRAQKIVFEPGELTINGRDQESMSIEVQFFVNVERRKLVSKFELKDQGRCFSFAPIPEILPGKSLQIDVVQLV